MHRRTRSVLVALAIVALALAGCAKAKTNVAGPNPAATLGFKTIVKGTLTVGSDMPYAPFESLDATGKPVGFDIELFNEVAARIGARVSYQNAVFDTIFTAVGTKWDVVVSSVTGYAPAGSDAAKVVADRSKIVAFTKPYYSSLQSLAVNATRTPNLKSTADLKSGDRVAVQTGTTGAFYAKSNLESKGVSLVSFDKAPDMFLALQAGSVVGVMNDLPVSLDAIKGKADLKVVQQIETGEQYAFAAAKDNPKLVDAVNAALDKIFTDGTYVRIFKKYFPEQELPSYVSGGATSSP
jgi:polar amino acid transport system substrate-binding protein